MSQVQRKQELISKWKSKYKFSSENSIFDVFNMEWAVILFFLKKKDLRPLFSLLLTAPSCIFALSLNMNFAWILGPEILPCGVFQSPEKVSGPGSHTQSPCVCLPLLPQYWTEIRGFNKCCILHCCFKAYLLLYEAFPPLHFLNFLRISDMYLK